MTPEMFPPFFVYTVIAFCFSTALYAFCTMVVFILKQFYIVPLPTSCTLQSISAPLSSHTAKEKWQFCVSCESSSNNSFSGLGKFSFRIFSSGFEPAIGGSKGPIKNYVTLMGVFWTPLPRCHTLSHLTVPPTILCHTETNQPCNQFRKCDKDMQHFRYVFT